MPWYPKKTEAVVMKALAKNIEERYPNAGVFSMDIRALLSGGKTIARPESPLKVPLLFIKRHALMLILSDRDLRRYHDYLDFTFQSKKSLTASGTWKNQNKKELRLCQMPIFWSGI